MSFLDSLINGLKNGKTTPQVLANGQPITTVDPSVVGGVQTTNNQAMPNTTPIQNTQQKANAITNVLKGLAPTNWSDETRNKVLLASKFLSGFGGTQYNPNESLLGNVSRGLGNGANAAYNQVQNYNNYLNTKSLYDQLGLDSNGLSPVADYSSMTPAQIINLGIKQQQDRTRREIANANDNTKRLNLIMNGLKNGALTPDEALSQAKLYGLNLGSVQESNETRRTNSQIDVNNARAKQIEASIRQNDERIKILKQRVAQGNATLKDREILNQLNIQNKRLLIEQNELINKTMRKELGNDGNGEGGSIVQPTGRPIGQKGIIKSF